MASRSTRSPHPSMPQFPLLRKRTAMSSRRPRPSSLGFPPASSLAMGSPTSLCLLFFATGTKRLFPDIRGQEQRLFHTAQHSGLCVAPLRVALSPGLPWRWWDGRVYMTLFLLSQPCSWLPGHTHENDPASSTSGGHEVSPVTVPSRSPLQTHPRRTLFQSWAWICGSYFFPSLQVKLSPAGSFSTLLCVSCYL